MIDLILLAAGTAPLESQPAESTQGQPRYRAVFEAARQAADAMLGLRVLAVIPEGALGDIIREFGFNKVVVPGGRSLSEAIIAGTRAARSGACRCFLPCDQTGLTGAQLTGFLQGYILSGRPLGRTRSGEQLGSPMVFAPYLLPGLLALKGDEDGASLFQGREDRTFFFDVSAEAIAEP